MALLMNPSTAGHLNGDATVAKLHRLAVRWDFGRLLVANVNAYRCTDQARLAEVEDPCGPDNYASVWDMASRADMILVGYGKPRIKALRQAGPEMCRGLLREGHWLHVLRLSADGTPWHPLYVRETTEPVVWGWPDA